MNGPSPTRSRDLIVLAVTALASLIAWYGYIRHFQELEWWTAEDGVLETGSALIYLLASFLCLVACWKSSKTNLWLWGFAGLFFLIAGEEVSWGQRLFDIQTPTAFREINVQGETNLHNIEGVHGIVRAASLIVLNLIYVAVPLACRLRIGKPLLDRLMVPVAPVLATALAVFATLFMLVPRMLGSTEFVLDEIGEFYLSVAALGLSVQGAFGSEKRPRHASAMSAG